MEKITSRKNATIKEMQKIAVDAGIRKKQGMFFCEGARLCEDAAKTGINIKIAFFTETALQKYSLYIKEIIAAAEQYFEISDHVADALSGTKNPQGVFCLCGYNNKGAPSYKGRVIVMENTQDPSNVGAAMRTAEALGINEIIMTGNCCDIYSPKSLRASMGALFRMPAYVVPDTQLIFDGLKRSGCTSYASLPDNSAKKLGSFSFDDNCAVFIGNEGGGLSEKTIASCTKRVTIPMSGRAESLNAAAAAAILMWEMVKDRRDGFG